MQSMTPWVSSCRRGQALGLHERLRLVVEADQVGERAADIDRNEDHAITAARAAQRIAAFGPRSRYPVQRCLDSAPWVRFARARTVTLESDAGLSANWD